MNVFWVTGLPGSGKTTFSRDFQNFLNKSNIQAILLDGDDLRAAFNQKFGYTKVDRIQASRVYINLAKLFAKQGFVVIVSTVSLFKEVFEYLQSEIPSSKTVFIDASTRLLDLRNQKHLRSAEVGSSPGVTLQVDFPNNPFVKLRGDETQQDLGLIFETLRVTIK